jgi:hypothetical protein
LEFFFLLGWLRGHPRGSSSAICFGFGRGINSFSKIYARLVFNTAGFVFCARCLF